MRQEDQERDYRVGTKLELDPDSFVQVVIEAFLLEHGVTKQKDIAGVMGVHPTRVNQIFKNPGGIEASSVRAMLDCLTRPAVRKRVFDAWTREAFGERLGRPENSTTSRVPTIKTLRRIDRMIRESRMTAAASLAAEVAEHADNLEIQEMALDRLFWCKQRLDEPGQAMRAACEIVGRAKDRGEPEREAAGHYLRIRCLMGLVNCTDEELVPIIEHGEYLASLGSPNPDVKYMTAHRRHFALTRRNMHILFMERGQSPIDGPFLNTTLQSVLTDARSAKSYQARYHAWQVAARIYTLLGQPFQAAEAIDKAFETGKLKNLNAFEMSGLLVGRIQKQTEDPDEVTEYLLGMSNVCRDTEDRYHLRLIEWELARHLSRQL